VILLATKNIIRAQQAQKHIIKINICRMINKNKRLCISIHCHIEQSIVENERLVKLLITTREIIFFGDIYTKKKIN